MEQLGGTKSFLRRNNVQIGGLIIMIALGAILLVQALAVRQLSQQVKNQQDEVVQLREIANQTRNILASVNTNAQQQTKQIDGINDHINCIFTFFTLDPKARAATVVAPLPPGQKTCMLQTATGTVTVPLTSTLPVITTPKPSPTPVITGAHQPPSSTPPTPTSRPVVAAAPTTAPGPSSPVPFITRGLDNLLNRLLGVQ